MREKLDFNKATELVETYPSLSNRNLVDRSWGMAA
jgi:hypothetical protein